MRYIILSLLLSFSLNAQECKSTRALLDIGSGTIKLLVAEVNRCQGKIEKILSDSESVAVSHKQDLAQSGKRKKFSEAVMTRGLIALKELKAKGEAFSPTEWRALATAAFREAKNGSYYGSKIESELKVPLTIISQKEEALLGLSAVEAAFPNESKLCVWDIGGGSMQITARNEKKEPLVYGGDLASVSFKNMVIEKIKKGSILNTNTPNPLGVDDAKKAVAMAKEYVSKKIDKHLKSLLPTCKMMGIGGVHYYSIKKQLNAEEKYTREALTQILPVRALLDDKSIGGEYANTDVTNIALVLGLMEAMNLNEVYPVSANLSHGALTVKEFWK